MQVCHAKNSDLACKLRLKTLELIEAVQHALTPSSGETHQLSAGVGRVPNPLHYAGILKLLEQLRDRLLGDAEPLSQERRPNPMLYIEMWKQQGVRRAQLEWPPSRHPLDRLLIEQPRCLEEQLANARALLLLKRLFEACVFRPTRQLVTLVDLIVKRVNNIANRRGCPVSSDLDVVADGLWCIDHSHSMMGIRLGLRTVIVNRGDGRLLLYSPGPLTSEQASRISELGEVCALIAPNGYHHLFVAPARELFPSAKVYASPGIRTRAIDLEVDEVLDGPTPPRWTDVALFPIQGMPGVEEVVMLHRPSRSLMVCDLSMNVCTSHFGTSLFMRLNGRYRELGPTRFLKLQVKDRAAYEASVRTVLEQDFDRVVVLHGDIVHSGGRAQLRSAFDL